MIALAGVATVELTLSYFASHYGRRAILKFAFSVYLIGLAVFGVALWLAFGSDYMSREVIARAVRASQFLLSRNQGRELFGMLALLVVPVVGWWWFCPGVFFVFDCCRIVPIPREAAMDCDWPAACSRRNNSVIGYLLVDISCRSATPLFVPFSSDGHCLVYLGNF